MEKRLKKRLFPLSCALALSLCLAGCGIGDKGTLELADFSGEGQSFVFPGTEWGMTVSELEEALGGALQVQQGELPGGESPAADHLPETFTGGLFSSGEAALQGIPGQAGYQFQDGKLWAANISCEVTEKSYEKFTGLLEDAREEFGGETEAQEQIPLDEEGATYSSYRWERESADGQRTVAVLTALLQDGEIRQIILDTALPAGSEP